MTGADIGPVADNEVPHVRGAFAQPLGANVFIAHLGAQVATLE
jgi:hypothetical protein